MSGQTVLVLGGGLGGLTAAFHLRRLLPAEHRVLVIEKQEAFSLPMANLWLMTGERAAPGEGARPLARLAEWGIEWVQGDITAIDPGAKAVTTSAGSIRGDYLIVALGAEKRPDAVPGFAEAALNLYAPAGAQAIHRALDSFHGGRIVVLISRTPFSCPSAPYEAALLIDAVLRQRGVRARATMAVYTPEDQPMAVAGPAMGSAIVEMLQARDITFQPEEITLKIDPARRRILFEIDETTYDLLVGVPTHTVPGVVRASGLTDASGWVAVDPTTLQTRHPGVFAVGDVTAVRLPVGMFLPKAGVFADGQARVVAARIAADITGAGVAGRFDGHGFCYVEVGDGLAAYGAGDFYALPRPRVTLAPPAARYRREKLDLERSVLARWD